MSESEYVKTIFKRYWKILLKWLFRIHGLPEITINELHEKINFQQPPLMIDIRSTDDYYAKEANGYGHIPNALHIDILELESSLNDLESHKNREIVTMCAGGGLSLAAVEILRDAGFHDVKSLRGGTDLWHKKGYPTTTESTPDKININIPRNEKQSISNMYTNNIQANRTVDARGLSCPMPILRSRKAIKQLDINQILEILTSDPGSLTDIPRWAQATGQELLLCEELGPNDFRFLIKKI